MKKKNCVKNRTSNDKFRSNSFEARGKLVLCIHWHDYYCAIFRNMDFKFQTHTIFILFILNDRNIEWHVSCTIFYIRHFIDGFSDPAIPTESFTYAYQSWQWSICLSQLLNRKLFKWFRLKCTLFHSMECSYVLTIERRSQTPYCSLCHSKHFIKALSRQAWTFNSRMSFLFNVVMQRMSLVNFHLSSALMIQS